MLTRQIYKGTSSTYIIRENIKTRNSRYITIGVIIRGQKFKAIINLGV